MIGIFYNDDTQWHARGVLVEIRLRGVIDFGGRSDRVEIDGPNALKIGRKRPPSGLLAPRRRRRDAQEDQTDASRRAGTTRCRP